MLTIVMPCWNSAFVLSQTIDSIYAQTVDNFKVVIVNDGSTDNTSSILEQLNDPRFDIVTLPFRRGAGFARNLGNRVAISPLISVLDCGDVLYQDKVEKTVEYFKNNPTIDIMCAATDSLDGSPARTPRLYKGTVGEKLGFEHPGVTYKKEVTERIKYRTTSLETDQYDAFFFECGKAKFKFGIYTTPLSSKCTFDQYNGGRNLDEALLVKAGIYREFNIPLPQWLIEHEQTMKLVGKENL